MSRIMNSTSRLFLWAWTGVCLLLPTSVASAQNLLGMAVQYERDNKLYVIDPATAKFIGGVTVRLPGSVVVGCNGLATHPVTGELWGLLMRRGSNHRFLAKINPVTGAATLVGDTTTTGNSLAGLAFNANGSILYGVVGDGGNSVNNNDPESLVTVNQSTGAVTVLCTLGNGDDGEAIGFANGILYHGSGNNTQVFETIDNIGTCSTTDIPLSGDISEFLNLAYSTVQNVFYMTGFDELFTISATGTVNFVGEFSTGIELKGLAFNAWAPPKPPCMAFAPLYVSTTFGSSAESSLWAVDPNTGTGLFIGMIGFERVGSLEFGANNVLYGVGERLGTSTAVLITINPCTGVGTEIGPTTGLTSFVTDLSFRNADQVLYAYTNGHNVFTLDTSTGAATLVGPSGVSGGGNGIAFSPGDVLFHSHEVSLHTINPATGAATVVINMTFPPGPANPYIRASCMDFLPGTSDLYAVINEYDNNAGQNDQWYLAKINTATGAVTAIGQTVSMADGMVFAPAGPDGDYIFDQFDNCPNTFNPLQENADGDSVGDACDGCPSDAAKTAPGLCGCGFSDADTNGDGTPDCQEQPPNPQPTPPQHVVDRNALLTFLSFLFGVPLCAPGTLMVLPLTIVGLTGMKVWRRRRR